MTDYAKILSDMEAEDDGLRASQAVTPAGQLPTMRFADTPATAKAVLRSPNPQGEVPTWEQMSVTERLMNGLEGGYHGLQKSRAATAAYEAEQAAQAGLSALVDDDEDESVKELLSRDTQANRDYKEKQAAARDKAIYEYADLAKKDKEYVTPLAVQNASQKAKGKGFWSGLGTALTEMAADPLNSALYLGTSSLGAIAPYMALSAAGGGLLGAARLTSAARAVQMATMFKGSYDNELGNYLIKAMQGKGIDLQNPDAMRTALQADDMAETYEKGKKRAAVVGAFDAVAALAAPIRLNPSNAIRTVRDAAGILKASGLHGVDKVKSIPEAFGMARSATPTSRGGMWGYNLENHLTQAGLQGVLGGAGEALGSLAAGDEINWADVLFEAIGELTSAPVEVVSMTASVNAAYNAQQQQAQAAKVLGENMQKVTAAVAAMGTQVKDGQTIADWANDVGQDKSVFSFAQDLVDAGVPDKIRQAAPELAARIETAAQNKSDVAIPVSDVVKLAATDEAAANSLLYESRVDADGMSPRQAEDFMKNGKQEAVAAFDKIVKDTKPDAEMRKAIDTEVAAIRKQLIDAGTAEDVADLQTRPWASWLAIRAKQTGLSPKEIMGKMNLRIRRQQSQTPAFQQQLSTAMPSEAAVKKGDYPNPRFARQWADFAEAKKNSRYFERAVAAMKTIPGVKGAVGRVRNAGKASERIIDFMADNLVWLYDKMPAAERERAKLWYDGGNKTARVWAQRYGLRLRQVAAVIAIFSPQNGWFNNMTNAERLFDIYFSARREKPSAEMQTALKTLCESDKKVSFDEIKGKSLEELIQADQMRGAALWVRAYDAVTNPSTYNVLTPEGGVGGLASVPGGQGKPAKAFFFNPQSIADALSVIVDGSVDNIYDKIGTQFKVRDFYNNLYDPSNAKAATIDTHAVGADTLTIQSSNSQPVQDNFGAVGNKTSGQNGTYPLHFEAYRRAAERVGLSPREIQSITWEAVRVLFEPNRKRVLRSVVDDIWKEFDAGKISADEARQKIFDAAGGLSKLSWQDTPFNDRITETYDRSGVTLYDDVRQPEPEPVLTMEAAPDPNNAEAVAQWNELSPADKLAVTRKIVPWLLERVAEQTHTHIGEPELQRGGYLGDPNYSILCRIADGGDYVKVGRLLASYLRQDSVMAISQTNGEGMFTSKVIRIQLPDGFTEAQVDDLYRNHIDQIRDSNGERLIMGQSTAGGVMMLSVDAEHIDEIKAGIIRVLEPYNGELPFGVDDAYTGFLTPYSEEEKTNAGTRNDTGREGGVRQEASAGYDADLQSETDKRLAQAIKAKIASRPRGFGQSGVYTAGTGGVRPMDERSSEGGVRGTRSPGESGQRFEGGIVRESDVPTTAEYGEKGRPNAVRVLGIHMSAVNRPSLNSRYYGTGLKGQELKRLTKTGPLSDVYSRIYFYLDTGKGIIPEEGVGREAHSIWLNNIYDLDEDPLGLLAKGRKESSNDDWAFTWTEHFIKAAGFDGYIVHHFGRGGAVCLLGDQHDNVRPQYQGRVQALNAAAVTSAHSRQIERKLDPYKVPGKIMIQLQKLAQDPSNGIKHNFPYITWTEADDALVHEVFPDADNALATGFFQSSENAFTPDEELIRKAVDNFGTTDSIDEAFYILPDGTMLDGSGRHWGLEEQDVNGRQVDHADVAEVVDTSGVQAMYDFMARTGAMRIDSAHGVASISRPPTPAQLGILENSSKGNYLALSYNTPEGRIVDDTEFDSASPEEIGTFFAEAEEKAALGIAGAYAQTAYHGSPFKFDRFTLDHIGAGAGTQQHGYGLYFAMNRKTAESYRDALAGGGEYTVNGKPVSRNLESADMEDLAATWVLREMPGTQKHPKPAQVKRAAETAIKRLNEDTERGQVDKATSSKLRNELAKIYQQPKDYSIEYTPSTEGRVYRTDIPDSDVLLSEEAAMVDQPVVVRKALQKLAFDLVAEGMDDLDKGTTSPRADARNKVIELIGKDSAEGRDVYSWLTAYAGGSKEASELLNLYGIKGLEYFSEPDGNCAVIWDDTALKILNSLEQPEQSGTRGSMMPSNAGDVRPGEGGVMTLMESADKSTFLHESAHAWLDADTMLAQDIADKVLAGGELTDGERAFLTNLGGFFRWGQQEGVLDLGVTDDLKTVAAAVRAWAAMPINDQRGMHELFAEGFESYLLEGVSPNAEMKTIFGRFKKWLMDIYAQATRQPHPISPEVRKLYDLMFATEQQAMETQQKLGMRALFDGEIGKRLGMTDEELAAYNALNEEATQEAEGLIAKAVHGVLRIYGNIRRKEARRILRERRDEVNKRTDEILEEPRFRALSLLTHGLKSEDGTTSRMTIELKTLSRCGIDAETAQLLMDRGWVTEGRGVSPEVLANTAGTTDVVGLIGDLLELKSMNDAKTEAIKSVAYKVRIEGGMNPDAFDELQSNLAAHNETRSRFITAEFNALARALGKRQLMVSAAREYAVEQIGNMKLSDIRPGTFMNAERRCAAMAEQAMRKADFGACLEAKRGQVLNHEMARAALETLDRYQRGVRMAKRAMKSKTVHPAYKKLILALLDAHSVASMTAKEREDFGKLAADPAQLQELIKEVEDAGTPIEGLQRFIDSHEHAKDMTGYDSQDFFSVLKQLETLGRNVYNQNLAEELGRIDEIVKEGKEAIKEAADRQGRDVIENERVPFTRWERWRDNVHQFLLNHVKIQSWCRIFDQNQSGGFFWNLFIRSANERSTFENSMRAKVSKTLAEKLAPVFKKSQDEDPVIIPGFSKPFTHGQRIAVALNCGNDSNRQRLVDGDCRFTDEALQAIFATLTEADWRAVEAVWQQFEELRPLIAEKEKRVFGMEPEWIDYQPFMVKTAEGKIIQVSGGYYPVKFDPRGSNRAAKYADANDVRQEMQGAYQSATTRRSFTKSRAQGDVHMPLRIDLAALYEGFNDVIHDLAWHEWLIETKRVLDGVNGRDSGLRQAIKERYGYLVAKQFEDWRKDIATGGRDSADSWVNRMAANVGVATMGFSVTSAFVQLTGIGYVIPRVGIAPVMTAVGKFISDPVGLHRAITKKSEAMRLRGLTQNREIAQVRNRLESGKHWFKDHAYVMMTIMQNIVDSIAWQAAYERYTREGNSEDKAIAMADQVVIDTQSSGNVSDLSAIERSQGARLFTVFYSWMNAALNMGVVEAMGENDRAKAAARLLFMGAVMPVLESLFREALQAHDSDDDDDEDWTKQWLRKPLGAVVEYHLGLFLGLREVSSAAKSLIAGEPSFGYNGPAGTRMIANAANAMQAATDPLSWRGLKVLVDIAGTWPGAPSTQINRTIKGVRAIESGQAEGVDAVLAPLFGFSGKIDE
nr:MAG TPA: crystallin beta/gamma motif-containing protein [Caudoviricetes sp.]